MPAMRQKKLPPEEKSLRSMRIRPKLQDKAQTASPQQEEGDEEKTVY
jgi:hypothetical protein